MPRLLGILVFCSAAVLAQIRSGTIVGLVSDSTGAAASGVEVVVREVNTNATFTVQTQDSGEFVAPYLQNGTYEVTARKSGFKTSSRKGISLATAQTVRVDIQLEVGAVETSVSVTASTVELQSESSRVTNAIGEQVIKSIPNINNNPLNYAVLQQGVVARAAMNDTQSAQATLDGAG